MSVSVLNSFAVLALLIIPKQVIWAYVLFGLVIAIGLVTMLIRGDWQKARGFDKLILFGPMFYAAPLAAFGSEHFTSTKEIASLVPKFIPWHMFWAYFVGGCFIAAGLSFVSRVQARLAAGLVALTFFLFVLLMDAPGWAHHPGNRFAFAFMLRELSFAAGALALACSLTAANSKESWRERPTHSLATFARYCIAIAVLSYGFEQFMHADHVPGVPLEMVTPQYVFGHAIWTYLAAAGYVIAGIPLLIGRKTRAAAAWVGLTVLFVELVAYVPIAVVERASIEGFNYMADTLMFCGSVLLLAGAMPHEESAAGHLSREAAVTGR